MEMKKEIEMKEIYTNHFQETIQSQDEATQQILLQYSY